MQKFSGMNKYVSADHFDGILELHICTSILVKVLCILVYWHVYVDHCSPILGPLVYELTSALPYWETLRYISTSKLPALPRGPDSNIFLRTISVKLFVTKARNSYFARRVSILGAI